MRFLLSLLLISVTALAGENPYLKKISQTSGNEKITALTNYVNSIFQDSSERALPFAVMAESLAGKDKGSELHYTALSTLATVYHDLGKYDSSLAVADRGLRIAASKNDELGKATFLATYANVYRLKGNYEKALANYLEAIRIAEMKSDTMFLGFLYNAIGITYFDIKDYNNSVSYLRTGLKLKNVLRSEDRLTEYFLNIGSAFSELNMQDSAIMYWQRCNALAEKNDYHDMLSASFNNLAGSYFRLGQYDKTLEYGMKSLHLAERYKDKQSMTLYNTNIGELYAKLGDFDKAFHHLAIGLRYATELGYKRLILSSYQAYADVYELKNDYRSALDYQKRYLQLKDSIFSEENSKIISELNATYETEKKQRRIEMLSKESALQRSEVEKQKLIRNSMMGVSLLIGGMGLMVFRSYRQKKKANVLLTEQKEQINIQRELLEVRNRDITDSITYGRRIQAALLPNRTSFHGMDHFLLFRPRDIVSGDFYWTAETDGKKLFVVADCTGHGVPGAFMSLIGISLLNDLVKVKKLSDPASLLNALRDGVIESLNAEGQELHDGMDVSIALVDSSTNRLSFAGANNAAYLLRKSDGKPLIITLPADKMPVGKYLDELKPFQNTTMEIINGDRLILLSDGFADQFGGPHGKKFRAKQFKDILLESASSSIAEQGTMIEHAFNSWKSEMEQVDDVCVLGIELKSSHT